jgi:hypothetical protein
LHRLDQSAFFVAFKLLNSGLQYRLPLP